MAKVGAFYLKYRPQNLDELTGQESVKKFLLSSFANNKISHAYLFVGPRGTGKTSTARILAKMVNCENASNVPCNKCSICLSIADGSNMDLIEIDAASNRGIEDIRALRDKIKLAPTGSKKKVYIIDEVHMLTTEAFNALLKTLEEPPAHVLFILATTESSKIPQTILSRVQRLDFKLATPKELLEALEKIVKAEKIDIDEEALSLLVKKSEGSFRDGVKFLDQVHSLGGKITAKSIDQNFKSGEFENILDLIKNLRDKNATDALLNIGKYLAGGMDAKALILALMDTLRSLVFIKNEVGEQLVKIHLSEEKYESLVNVALSFTNADLIKNLDILQKALEKLKFTLIASLPLELAVVEICGEGQLKEEQIPKTVKLESVTPPLSVSVPLVSDSPDITKLKEKWTFVLETIRPYNFSLEALLRSINITECTETKVLIEVPYSFHQRILEAPKNRDLLESILSDILGRNMAISVSLGNRPARAEDVANIELAADDEIIRAAAEIFSSDTVN